MMVRTTSKREEEIAKKAFQQGKRVCFENLKKQIEEMQEPENRDAGRACFDFDDEYEDGYKNALYDVLELCKSPLEQKDRIRLQDYEESSVSGEHNTGEAAEQSSPRLQIDASPVQNPKCPHNIPKWGICWMCPDKNVQKKCTCGKFCTPLLKDDHKCGRCGGAL